MATVRVGCHFDLRVVLSRYAVLTKPSVTGRAVFAYRKYGDQRSIVMTTLLPSSEESRMRAFSCIHIEYMRRGGGEEAY